MRCRCGFMVLDDVVLVDPLATVLEEEVGRARRPALFVRCTLG